MRVCRMAFLWDNGPSVEEVKGLVDAKDSSVLNYSVGESSMLALAQSTQKEKILIENKVKFLPYFTKAEKFTYKQFSKLIEEAIGAVSK